MDEFQEQLLQLVSGAKPVKVYNVDYNGLVFDYIVIPRSHRAYYPIPYKYCIKPQSLKRPFLIFWTHKDGLTYTWYDLAMGEILSKPRYFTDHELAMDVIYLSTYYPKPIDTFSKEQMMSLLEKRYWVEHSKFSDVAAKDSNIFLLYRDRYDDKRYRKVVENYRWYFYIEKKDYRDALAILTNKDLHRLVNHIEEDGKWIKMYADWHPGIEWQGKTDAARTVVQLLTGSVQLYEADVDPATRYAIDNKINIETKLKILYYDIETDDSNEGIQVGRDQILSIAGVDNTGKEFFKCTKDEEELLFEFINYIRDYDIIVGFNNYNFDDEYILQRCKMYDKTKHFHFLNTEWRVGRVDMMRRVIGTFAKHIGGLTKFSLENVSQHFIGRGKIKHDEKIIELFKNNRKLLREYNLEDCHLVKDLDEKINVTELMIAMCQWTGSFPTMFRPTSNISGISVARLLDMYILRHAKERGIHYKMCSWDSAKTEKFEGAYIMEPEPGIYKDVHVFDFKSLYPSIIWSWRISPENRKPEKGRFILGGETIRTVNGIDFYKDRYAVFPAIVEELLAARKEYKKKQAAAILDSTEYKAYNTMQMVAKELTNSLYGQLGQHGNRYFDFKTAESIPAAGRYLLQLTKQIVETTGSKVFYGDTDSVFTTNLTMSPHDLRKLINSEIPKYLKNDFNIDTSMIEIEYEKRISKFISVMKKNYTGLLCELDGKPVDKIFYKGLECVKRSTLSIAKLAQQELIELLLRHDHPVNFYHDWILKKRNWFYSTTHSVDDLTLRTQISKNPKLFTGAKLPHVKVAQWLIDNQNEYYDGMQIPYIVVDQKEKIYIHNSVYEGIFDKNLYWQKIHKPLARILSPCFKDYDWEQFDTIQQDKRQKREERARKADEHKRREEERAASGKVRKTRKKKKLDNQDQLPIVPRVSGFKIKRNPNADLFNNQPTTQGEEK